MKYASYLFNKYSHELTSFSKFILHKETDKAYLVSADLDDCEDATPGSRYVIDKKWIPKSVASIKDGKLIMPRWAVGQNKTYKIN